MQSAIDCLNLLASKGIKVSVNAGQLECYAQKGMLTEEARAGLIKYRADIIALREGRKGYEAAREFPLSSGQKGLYLLQKLYPEMSAYNVPLCLKIRGAVNRTALAGAWALALERYPILTARVTEQGGDLYHLLDDACRTTLQLHALDEDESAWLPLLRQRVRAPFDLNRGPLTRADLYIRDQQQAVLLLTIHHLVFDGTSAMILLRTLIEFYRQCSAGMPVQGMQAGAGYEEFVRWEEAMLASPEGGSHARYWHKQLEGELPVLELQSDGNRPQTTSFGGEHLVAALPEDLGRWVTEFGKAQALPPASIFLAVWQLLLHRCTGQPEMIVGMPVMGRMDPRFAAQVGYFINMVPLRSRWEPGMALRAFMSKVQGAMLDALYHSSYPFPRMLQSLKMKPAEKNPVFQVCYAYQNFINPDDVTTLLQSHGVSVAVMAGISQEGEFDLGLEVFERAASFELHLKYNPAVYGPTVAGDLLDRYRTLLRSISEHPDRLLREYSVMTEPQRQALLAGNNATRAAYPSDRCIHQLFVDQVGRTPDAVAVGCGEEYLTYRQLQGRSAELALYLQSLGVGPDRLVGLCLERSLEMMVAIMGTEQAGGAYLPLDPDYPEERLAYMLCDSQPTVVLTQEKWKQTMVSLSGPGTRVVALDAEWSAVVACVAGLRSSGVALRQEVRPHHLSYVIYTSGSTGKPKGVEVEHRALVNRIHWMQQRYGLTADDVVLQKTPYSFDVSVWEFFWPLMAGASVVFAAPDGHKDVAYLEDVIRRERVTTLHFVPSMLRIFLETAQFACGEVRRIFCSGEALDINSAAEYRGKFPDAELHNLYGPTEAAIDVTAYDCSDLPHSFVPIGRPIANTQIYILDGEQQLQPGGASGELYIAGDGLARGYRNRPELTAERFVPNPFDPGTRMYKTGDLARWLPDGHLQYLGRIDTQVKIRGYRIELGEIEACLNRFPEIEDCIVLAQGQDTNKHLVAFYRARATQPEQPIHLPKQEMRAHLLRMLPAYMVPEVFVSLAAIPLNPSGKVDRRALAAMDVAIAAGRDYVAPGNDTEEHLVAIWAELLKVAPGQIGIHDNFFELGGHSLLATQLVAKIRHRLKVEVPLKALFQQTTVAQLAASIAGSQIAGSEKTHTLVIQPIDRAHMERLPLSFAQERVWYFEQLTPGTCRYNSPGAITIPGDLNVSHLDEAFRLMVSRHEVLRTIFPSQDGQAQQRILPDADFWLERIDLSHESDLDERDRKAKQICTADAKQLFDLDNGPLLRCKLIKLEERLHVLMLCTHHIVSDGWSLGVMTNEVSVIMEALRQGVPPKLSPLPIQYVDYAVWQRNRLEYGGVLERQLAYWKEKLAGVPDSLDLPTDYPRQAGRSLAGAGFVIKLNAQLTARLKALAERKGATLFMVLLAAFKVLLHRYTGQRDLCVGSAIANRQYAETEGLIGMFVNMLALRNQIEPEDTFSTFLSQVKATCLEAYEHQDAPFEKVVDSLRQDRQSAENPLFQVMVILQNASATAPAFPSYPFEAPSSELDLSIQFTETGSCLEGSMEYSQALYKPETIARMGEHFVALCRAIAATPTARICDLDFFGEQERQRVLVEFNRTEAVYPRDRCIHDLFVEQVRRTPQARAVRYRRQELRYEELHRRSGDLALFLESVGVTADSVVGVYVERSLEMMVGLMAIELAGAAYLPLDPALPDDRLEYMLQDSGAAVVVTRERFRSRLESLMLQGVTLVALDTLRSHGTGLRSAARPEHMSHLIYRSGHIGKPKGVAVEHRALMNQVCWMQKQYQLAEDDVVLQHDPYGIDGSVWEFFWPMMAGASVILAATYQDVAYVEDLIEQEQVTTLHFVPSILRSFVENAGGYCGSVRRIFLSGGGLDRATANLCQQRFPHASLHALYGPAEAGVDVAAYGCSRLEGPVVPIGRPIDNTQIYILDAQQNPQPIGIAGELCIAGDGLARGYVNRKEVTWEKFVFNPFRPGTRMYKTGDRARWTDDGNIELLSRAGA